MKRMKPTSAPQHTNINHEVGWWSILLMKVDEYRTLLLKSGVIIGLLVITTGVAVLTATRDPLFGVVLTALPFGAAFVLFLEKRMQFAPLAILFAAAFIPFSLPTGTGSRLVMSLVLAAIFFVLWALRMLLIERRIHIEPTYANLPVFGFIITTLFSIVWSAVFRDPLVYLWRTFYFVQVASAMVMVISPALLIFSANFLREEKHMRWMVWLMIALGVFGLLERFTPLPIPANTGGLASMWVLGLGLSWALFDQRLNKMIRVFFIVIAAIWFYHGFVMNISWVAGWLPGLVAGGVIMFVRSKWLFIIAVAAMALYIALNVSILERWIGSEQEISGNTRLIAWGFNWKFTSQHWLFGMGPAGYAAYYMTYNPTEGMATHSNYIDILAQTGVVGMTFYLAIFGVLVWRGLVVLKRVQGRRDFLEGLIVALLGGAAGCLVIMGFGDWLLPFAYTQTIMGFSYTVYSWLFLGMILSMDLLTRKMKEQGSL